MQPFREEVQGNEQSAQHQQKLLVNPAEGADLLGDESGQTDERGDANSATPPYPSPFQGGKQIDSSPKVGEVGWG